MGRFRAFDAWMGRFYDVVGNVVGATIGLFALAIALDLSLRLLRIGNLPGMHEIVEYLLFVGVFLAAPWVLRLGAHVRVDVAVAALPPATARAVERLLDGFGLVLCLVLAWFGSKNLAQAYQFQAVQRKTYDVYEWWLLTVFVGSFLLLALEFLSRLLRLPREGRG